jgi:hypothetical protein
MAGAFQANAFQDTPAFQVGAVVPFVGKSIIWGFYRRKRDAEAAQASKQSQSADLVETAHEEAPDFPPAPQVIERPLALQRLDAFRYLAELERERQAALAQEAKRVAELQAQAIRAAEFQAQAIRAAEFQRQQELIAQAIALQNALDEEAAQVFFAMLMNDIV